MAKIEVGKYYLHSTTGEKIHILAEVVSTLYGKCWCAETTLSYDFRAISSAAKWEEIESTEFTIKK